MIDSTPPLKNAVNAFVNEETTVLQNQKINNNIEKALYENCLSIPEIEAPVYRPKKVTVKYTHAELKTIEETFDGIDSRIIQHKIDHLDGILFVDKMTKYERDMIVPLLVALRQAHNKYETKIT
jgi:peptide deformylase